MITDQERIDILWKKIMGMTQTSSSTQQISPKGLENETIGSGIPLYSVDIWAYADQIPETPPLSGNAFISIETQLATVADPTSPRAFLTNKRDWITARFGIGYSVLVEINGEILPPNNAQYPWYFDYQAGVLYFPNAVPVSAAPRISGYRYTGVKGLIERGEVVPGLYEESTPFLQVGEEWTFSANTGSNIQLTDLWIDDVSQVGLDPRFADCEAVVECHWYTGYNSSNPYSFTAIKSHLADDGTYYISGQQYRGPKFVDLVNLEFPESGVTYWKIRKINQPGRVHLKFRYVAN